MLEGILGGQVIETRLWTQEVISVSWLYQLAWLVKESVIRFQPGVIEAATWVPL